MKRTLALMGALLISMGCAFSERIAEIGITFPLEFDQNYTTLSDILVQDLVIDLPALADGLGSKGFVVNSQLSPTVFANVNLGKFGVGGFAGLNGYTRFSISKDLFKLISNGNNLDEGFETALSAGMEVFGEIGAPVKLKFGKLDVKATPSLFVPVVYLPNPNAKIRVENDEDGNIAASANAKFSLYTLFDTSLVMDEKYNFKDLSVLGSQDWVSLALASAGFDLDAAATYQLFNWLKLGGYTHVPLLPGHLRYATSGEVSGSAKLDAILDSISSGEEINYGYEYEVKDVVFEEANFVVNRPFRVGAEGYFTPFGKSLVFGAKVGFATRNPFSDGYSFNDNSYMEYEGSVSFSPIPLITIGAASSYEDEVFCQSINAEVDLRLVELRVGIGSSSTSFAKSLMVSGIKAYLGLTLGF